MQLIRESWEFPLLLSCLPQLGHAQHVTSVPVSQHPLKCIGSSCGNLCGGCPIAALCPHSCKNPDTPYGYVLLAKVLWFFTWSLGVSHVSTFFGESHMFLGLMTFHWPASRATGIFSPQDTLCPWCRAKSCAGVWELSGSCDKMNWYDWYVLEVIDTNRSDKRIHKLCTIRYYTYIYIHSLYTEKMSNGCCILRRKFRSQTFDSMQRWKSRGGKSQDGEVKKWEDKRWRKSEERRCRCAKR